MAKTPRPTLLNLSVLRSVSAGRTSFPNQIDATSAPHIMRCMRAGLIEVEPESLKAGRPASETTLRLTAAGIAAISELARTHRMYDHNGNPITVVVPE